jgi:spermidine/putrescine transport system substrate-binding protein
MPLNYQQDPGFNLELIYQTPDFRIMSEPLNIMCWDGYQEKSFNASFERDFKTTVHAHNLLSDYEAARDLINADGLSQPCHVLNINNAYIKKYLYPAGRVKVLDGEKFQPYLSNLLPEFDPFLPWTGDEDQTIGVGQRFGTFNLVVNLDRISLSDAQDQGFKLVEDNRFSDRFGILTYTDFNLFHLCIASDLNPFEKLNDSNLVTLEQTAHKWCQSAKILTDDHRILNKALVDGDIDFYLSGGVYTASQARQDGHLNIQAVTPSRGPINGKGGIAFAEITSVISSPLRSPKEHTLAEDYLEYLLKPEQAFRIAFCETTCNPVAQMNDPEVFKRFSRHQLDIIQWGSLAEDMANCVPYDSMPSHLAVWKLWEKIRSQYSHKIVS